MEPYISVITTVKNGEKFIFDMLSSVNSQSYKNFEHIIVNDGSIDNTALVVQQFIDSHSDSRIKLINTSGIGRGRALNLAVQNSKGVWVAVIDADDLWHYKKLEIQISFCNEENSVIATDSLSFSDIKVEVLFEEIDNANDLTVESLEMKHFISRNHVCHSSVLIKKELCLYDENRESQFDLELWLRLAYNKNKIKKIKQTLTFHRIHKNQHFESMLGNKMAINSFKLKQKYGLLSKSYSSVIKNFLLMIYSVTARKILKKKS